MESPSHGIYLDWNATSPVHPEVADAVMPFLRGEYGNPSAPYAPGRAARERIEAARAQTAALIGAAPEEIIFTSGGTESNNLAIKGACAAQGKSRLRRLVTSVVEHPSVIETCRWLARQGCELTVVPVDGAGRVDVRDVEAALRPDATLLSIMHANNETGTIEPVQEIGRLCRERGILFHVDGIQAAGKIRVDVRELGCDLYSISAHKFGGLKGAGALYVRKGVAIEWTQQGGRQEGDRRAGTENVPGIVALGQAAEVARRDLERNLGHYPEVMRPFGDLVRKLPAARLNGHPTDRLPNTVNLCCLYADAVNVVLSLSLLGVYVGTGSACSSRRQEPSRVLRAMGLSEMAALCSIRISAGPATVLDEAERAAGLIAETVERIRRVNGPETIGRCAADCPCFFSADAG
ncbi:MAG: cysteine desulfurase family protein [Candidatus Brocadiia bacterium]|jgi:cysteine desulfurase